MPSSPFSAIIHNTKREGALARMKTTELLAQAQTPFASLERVSNGVLVLRNLFKQFDTDDNNVVSRDEFAQVCAPSITAATGNVGVSFTHCLGHAHIANSA